MKIALINPPRSPHNGILEHASVEARRFIHKKLIGPPLGLLTLAANLKDYDIELLEMKGEYDLHPESPPPLKMVLNFLERVNPDIVGVTFIASEFGLGMEIFRTAKQFNPEILTVAGGLHASLCTEDFNDPAVDIICIGPGGESFRQIVQNKEAKKGFSDIAATVLRKDGRLIASTAAPQHKNPAREGFIAPDRSLLNRWKSTYVVGNATSPSTYIYTSLGCPYSCTFCSIWPQFKGHFYQREVESIIEELHSLDGYDIVRFSDANTLVNLDFVNHLFDRIKEENIQKTFIMDIRADTAADNPHLIEKLSKCGLRVVITGFETIRKDDMDKYNKLLEAEKIKRAIDVFHQNNIQLRGNYIIPTTYNHDDFDEIADYAAAHRVTYAGYTILTPFPGTSLYQQQKKEIVDYDLEKYNMFNCVTRTTLPKKDFYRRISDLWLIRKGKEII